MLTIMLPDSEIAVVIEGGETVESAMNGQSYQASKFATTLRRQLWRKHLGLLPHQVRNIFSIYPWFL